VQRKGRNNNKWTGGKESAMPDAKLQLQNVLEGPHLVAAA
jgi:hypothetical protein